MCDANGAVPGTQSAVRRSTLYSEQGPLRLFAEQLLQGVSEGGGQLRIIPAGTFPQGFGLFLQPFQVFAQAPALFLHRLQVALRERPLAGAFEGLIQLFFEAVFALA